MGVLKIESQEKPGRQVRLGSSLLRAVTWIADFWGCLGRWLQRHYLKPVLAIAALALPVYLWLLWKAVWIVLHEITFPPPDPGQLGYLDARQKQVQTLGLAITGLGALLAVPLVLIRAYESKRHATIAEQAHITSRYSQAATQLAAEKTITRTVRIVRYKKGDEKHRFIIPFDAEEEDALQQIPEDVREEHQRRMESDERYRALPAELRLIAETYKEVAETVPNLEARLSAIYALEGISRDNEEQHIPVMETLCFYIRRHAPAKGPGSDDSGKLPWSLPHMTDPEVCFPWPVSGGHPVINRFERWLDELAPPRDDIQVALTVIGRRSEERIAAEKRIHYRLDLRKANLGKADLRECSLQRARLNGARLEGADLSGAKLEEVDLSEANLKGTTFRKAMMASANIENGRLELADLKEAQMKGVNLNNAIIQWADFRAIGLRQADIDRAMPVGDPLYLPDGLLKPSRQLDDPVLDDL